jgi:hypothetical protein
MVALGTATARFERVACGMRRLLLLILLGFGPPAAAQVLPTCEELVASIAHSFDIAHEVVLAVTVWQGSRELAHEASLLQRNDAGAFEGTTIARRGLRRPAGAGDAGGVAPTGGFDLPCVDHEVASMPSGEIELRLSDPEAPVRVWTLRFSPAPQGWLPISISVPFEVRVLLVPVRGRFVSEFSGWVFGRP